MARAIPIFDSTSKFGGFDTPADFVCYAEHHYFPFLETIREGKVPGNSKTMADFMYVTLKKICEQIEAAETGE
jgi:hypothetical protein